MRYTLIFAPDFRKAGLFLSECGKLFLFPENQEPPHLFRDKERKAGARGTFLVAVMFNVNVFI